MRDVTHRVVVCAALQRVSSLAIIDGLSQGWNRNEDHGDVLEGANHNSFFDVPAADVVGVTRLDVQSRVAKYVVGGAEKWVSTKSTSELIDSGARAAVLFTHANWRDPSGFMAYCNVRRAHFLFSLKSLLTTGQTTPFPRDLKFSLNP